MRVRHPSALDADAPLPDAWVYYAPRRRADVDPETGIFEVPDDARMWLDVWAEGVGYDAQDLLVSDASGDTASVTGTDPDESAAAAGGTCGAVKTDDEVCGRELPCQYHGE